jgi:hypothetical protein
MQEITTGTVMETVHSLMREEFGRQAVPLERDDTVQPLRFPGGSYMLLIRQCTGTSVRIYQAIGTPDFEMHGLSSFMLGEHRTWVFGRLERDGDTLVVSHSIDVCQLEGSLVKVVDAVHSLVSSAVNSLQKS